MTGVSWSHLAYFCMTSWTVESFPDLLIHGPFAPRLVVFLLSRGTAVFVYDHLTVGLFPLVQPAQPKLITHLSFQSV